MKKLLSKYNYYNNYMYLMKNIHTVNIAQTTNTVHNIPIHSTQIANNTHSAHTAHTI